MLSEVYDLECLSNLFTYTGYCRQTKVYHQFVIHSSRNDYKALLDHLFRDKLIMIGFNNDSYDYPLIHHLIDHANEYVYLDGRELAERIYTKSQEIISMEFCSVADWNKKIPQVDLFKIWHYDNAAKSTSLKALEISMNLPFVEDMPFDHDHWISKDEIEAVLSYNKRDVIATDKFLDITLGKTDHPLYKGKDKIAIRRSVELKYGLKCINFNDIKLGTELILKLYCKRFNKNPATVRKLRTPRSVIRLADCIPPWCDLKAPGFIKMLDFFKKSSIIDGITKGVLQYSAVFNGFKFDYGAGGCHGCIKPGVYRSDDEWIILDWDIDGMYPNLAITQGLYIEHLGPEFIEIYDGEIVSIRTREKKKPKKERDFVIVEGFKLASNGTYGKSNEEKSWLYDPLYTMMTTIPGQILISMWAEKLVNAAPGSQILQVNTN